MSDRPTGDATGIPQLRLALQDSDMTIEVEKSGMLLGRHTEADVRLPTPDISRKHCRFVFRDGQWVVLDLNSMNGTFVNEEQVQHAVLRIGDVLRVGNFRFLVEIGASRPTSLAERIFRMPSPAPVRELRHAS